MTKVSNRNETEKINPSAKNKKEKISLEKSFRFDPEPVMAQTMRHLQTEYLKSKISIRVNERMIIFQLRNDDEKAMTTWLMLRNIQAKQKN